MSGSAAADLAMLRAAGPGMLRMMLRMRVFEETLLGLFMAGGMPGTMHQSIGQEAVSAGVGAALRPTDRMTSSHRGHAHAIAKGLPLAEVMAEMLGRTTGSSGGVGGSMHIFDLPRGFLGTTGIVGGAVPIAVGAALAAHLEGSDQVVVAFFGDGASNQGAVHEALNLAAIWRLPVLFVCENNGYAVSLPASRSLAVSGVAARAPGYGMPGLTVDGQDAMAVLAAASEAISRARAGEGPTLMECMTYRYRGHSRFEPARYRTEDELAAWLARDPIAILSGYLEEAGLLDAAAIAAMRTEVAAEVDAAVRQAKAGPPVDPATIPGLVFTA